VATGDTERVLSNATTYLEAFGHIVIAWIWLEQELAAVGDGTFHDGKRAAARYFFAVELPKTGPQLDLLERLDGTVLDTPTTIF
jgi:butyryl-CoA dehydrogenase